MAKSKKYKEMMKDLREYKKQQLKKPIRTKALKTGKTGITYGYETTTKGKKLSKQKTKERKVEAKKFSKEKDFVSSYTDKLKGSKKDTKARAKKVGGFLRALGVTGGKQTYAGAGRPRRSYKYGVPIQVYKQQLRDKKALYQRYQQEQYARLKPRGFSQEQMQQLQQQQTMQQIENPSPNRVNQIQERVEQMRGLQQIQIVPQRQFQKMRVPTNQHRKLVQPGPSVADEELSFRKWSAETSISPRTQRMLDQIRRIQNKGKSDNIEQQRRLRERNMVGRSMNLMKAHENMIDTDMDFTGVDPDQNILMAPSVFKENPDNNILRNSRGGMSILNTQEAGNDLHF